MTLKILMNSLYGALANRYFPLFNEQMASAITGNGRYFIRGLGEHIENILKEVSNTDETLWLYSDTDSVMFTVKHLVNKFLEKNPDASINDLTDFCVNIENKILIPRTQEFIDRYAKELNAFDKSMIGAGREIIASESVMSAKKKYYMRVRDDEGKRYPIEEPSYKIQGMDIIKGGTPQYSKEHLRNAIPVILDSDALSIRDYVKERKNDYLNYGLSDISQTQGVSRVDYVLGESGIPQGSRCALVHNDYIIKNNLQDQYNLIQGGDKIKKVFLNTPNKFGSNIIGYIDDNFIKEIPNECIDYDTMFEKGFLNMLELMTEPMNWNIKQETESLDDW